MKGTLNRRQKKGREYRTYACGIAVAIERHIARLMPPGWRVVFSPDGRYAYGVHPHNDRCYVEATMSLCFDVLYPMLVFHCPVEGDIRAGATCHVGRDGIARAGRGSAHDVIYRGRVINAGPSERPVSLLPSHGDPFGRYEMAAYVTDWGIP